ncbi:MAG: hypothetical protein CVU57_02915 [Deltaproteobacteria bacterium HGW-Deltaproteobacteria-15]|jgi:hypothetical protein|nr:MAG: hypothetical protein CVU57_02915 [Deltaproteobacteria bacterium HGW-Deltaproteobacteria-15]
MNWIQWIPMAATLVLLYVLRWSHIGITNFKVFLFIMIIWSLLLICFYRLTRAEQPKPGSGREGPR